MVELRKDVDFVGPIITGFTPTGFKSGDQRFDQGLLISPEQAVSWSVASDQNLDISKMLEALALSPAPEYWKPHRSRATCARALRTSAGKITVINCWTSSRQRSVIRPAAEMRR